MTRVAEAIAKHKSRALDIDLRAFFDNVRHHMVLAKVAQRVDDEDVRPVLKRILKASGKAGVPQGGVLSPLLSNLDLNEGERLLERAKEVTRHGQDTDREYARFADDLVILVDAYPQHDWRLKAGDTRRREELAKLHLESNEEKSGGVDLAKGESFGFLGFDFRRVRSLRGGWRPHYTPKRQKRTALLRKRKDLFRRVQSRPIDRGVPLSNPSLRGWVNDFAIGHSSQGFSYVRDWVEKKVRRHLRRARKLRGFGWKRWSRRWRYDGLGLFSGYRVRRLSPAALPTR